MNGDSGTKDSKENNATESVIRTLETVGSLELVAVNRTENDSAEAEAEAEAEEEGAAEEEGDSPSLLLAEKALFFVLGAAAPILLVPAALTGTIRDDKEDENISNVELISLICLGSGFTIFGVNNFCQSHRMECMPGLNYFGAGLIVATLVVLWLTFDGTKNTDTPLLSPSPSDTPLNAIRPFLP
jgi:hypothetical protein